MCIFCLTLSATAFAAVREQQLNQKKAGAARAIPVLNTVTDKHGNRYGVTVGCNRGGKTALVSTNFKVDYYYGGTPEDVKKVNNYKKVLNAYGVVTLSGGGSNRFGGTRSVTGATYQYQEKGEYIYNVSSLTGHHTFGCEGGTWNPTTWE